MISAVRFALSSSAWFGPLPSWGGLAVMAAGGAAYLLVLLNLVLKGLGPPPAFGPTRTLASSWFYAWTRNPMVLSALAFLVGMGLWMRSWLFLVWLLVIVSPASSLYLRLFEERELESRFGSAALADQAPARRWFPRRPRATGGRR
jgi:protein-S-isoprenylcysteine O-methyltransferase Ste14